MAFFGLISPAETLPGGISLTTTPPRALAARAELRAQFPRVLRLERRLIARLRRMAQVHGIVKALQNLSRSLQGESVAYHSESTDSHALLTSPRLKTASERTKSEIKHLFERFTNTKMLSRDFALNEDAADVLVDRVVHVLRLESQLVDLRVANASNQAFSNVIPPCSCRASR